MQKLIHGTANLPWKDLGFSYVKTPYRFQAHYKNGAWSTGELVEDNTITISEGATALNYSQEAFEGLKARATADGRVAIFRPHANAERLTRSALRLAMQAVPHDLFLRAVTEVVRANAAFVPPYDGSGASFYLRPLLLGIGDKLGLQAAEEYLFRVYASPVGPYFSGNKRTIRLITCDNDRAATRGIGHIKAGGNYAGTLLDRAKAKAAGYDDLLFLDSATRTYIDEVGSANFFAIKGNTLISAASPSILPSITRLSLLEVAPHLGLNVEERPIKLSEIADFDEVGCCGTAVVVAAISEINTPQRVYTFADEVGPQTQKIYNALHAIQCHTTEALPAFASWLSFVDPS